MRPRAVGRTHLTILLVYLLLATLLTWPTVTHVATHLPGDGGDDPAIAWNLWWVKHALLTLQANPLFSDYLFYPIGVNLAFYTLTILNALTAMPLTLTLGVVTASNLHMWFTFVAGGYGAFLLARGSGIRGSGNRESGIRESGIRESGIRESGIGKSGMGGAGVRRSGIAKSEGGISPSSDSPRPARRPGSRPGLRDRDSRGGLVPDSRVPDSPIPDSRFPESPIPDSLIPDSPIPDSRFPDPPTPDSLTLVAAVIAGGFYAFASSQLFYVSLGQFNIASSHWVPYTLLFVFKSRRDLPSLRWPALAALFLTMQAWAEMTYASFLLVFIALYVAYEVLNLKSQISNLKFALRNLFVLAFLFTLGISPLLAAMLPEMQTEGDFWVQGSGFAEYFSADLAGFLVPTMRHPILGGLVGHTSIVNFDKGQHVYLGFTLLILAAVGVGAQRDAPLHRRGFWLIAALFFAWLALGPTIHVNGTDTRIPGPFIVLQSLPFFKGNRYPSRYSVMLVLSLAMLAAMGIETTLRKVGRQQAADSQEHRTRTLQRVLLPALCALLPALFLFEHLSIPLPQSDMTVPAPYAAIAAERDQFTLLDIPVAWRNGFRITGPHHPGFMFGQFYQTLHGRRLLQGNTSRNPEFEFQYFTQAPVLNSVLALETGHQLPPERWEADRIIAGDVLRFFDIRYVVVRPCRDGISGDVPCTSEATLPYVEKLMPVEQSYRDPALALYRVNLPPLSVKVEVSATAPLGRLYFGEGWGAIADQWLDEADQQVWAQRRVVRLFVPLDGEAQEVTLHLLVPGEGQHMVVSANGWRSPLLSLHSGWGEYTLTLPAEAVQAGLNEIFLGFDRLYPVTSLLERESGSPGQSAIDASPAAILVQSAGQEVGGSGHIYVNGVDVSPNARGYNVAVVGFEGDTQITNFDTHLDPGASTALAAFLEAIPAGNTVAIAAADDASMNLGEEAVAALRSIGATGDLRGKFRWSHALIGVKRAKPGSALEALDGLRPVSVAAGPAVTEPRVAAAVGWIRFEKSE